MLRGIQSALKEIIQMVVKDELKYFGKIIKNRNRSVITNNGTVAFSKHRDDSSLFPKTRESDSS
jgi:hypothetical protein